ncbi:MAG: CoA transferase, partial [Dehalococcoidia bacterium]|nr:CoA transferase [Dehalococcoidia bacterium]
HAWLSVAWSHGGQVLTRVGPDMMECRDGWVMWLRRAQEPTVFVMIGRPDLIDQYAEADVLEWRDPASTIWVHVREWCKTQSKLDVYHQAQELRIPVTPVNTMADLLASEQLAAREWILRLHEDSEIRHAGFPFKMSASTLAIRHGAPALGESGAEWLPREEAPSEILDTPPDFSAGPLAGLRVVEVTANWAGPLAGRHLGDLGAEVIKVEHSKRPATRAMWPAGNDPADRQFNRSGYFNKLNRNKMDVSLDLQSPEGREVFLRLVERADIVIENNSARVMPNLGLGYDTLSALNPRLVMASISGFGATGPEQHYVAYGANIEASSGLASLMGYEDDERPYRAGTFYADPIAGNYTVAAVLAALRERRWTGRGQWIDLALNEAAATFYGGAFVRYQREGQLEGRRGNRHQLFAPQGCYQTLGSDAWLALTVRDEDEWRALAEVVGRPDWLIEPQFQTHAGRAECLDEIDDAISAWAAARDHRRATRELQAAGVPAAPVMANWELLSDPHLAEREFYVPVNHPEVGVFPFPGMPWKLTRTPGTIRRPAPLFAEHNREVLGGILGMSDAEIEALETSGVAAPEPEASFFAPRLTPRTKARHNEA